MKIIGVEHKVESTDCLEDYIPKIAEALSYKPDIIIGPDYGLCFLDHKGKLQFGERERAIRELEKLSLNSPDTIILPGTGPFLMEEGIMGHAVPMIRNGETRRELRKGTDIGDSAIAEKNNLVYERGNYHENKFYHNGKKIAVEVCSDHGKQKIDKDTFLELIPAYDDRAGFYPRANSDDFSRYAIVVDGRKPSVKGFEFNLKKEPKISFLEDKRLNSSLFLFNLDERAFARL